LVDRIGPRQRPRTPHPLPLPEETSVALELPVDIESARLAMTTRALTPLVEPGARATFEVTVRHGDQPIAGAEVALLVVDEAVLALSERTHADPLAPFYARVGTGTTHSSTLGMVADAGPA